MAQLTLIEGASAAASERTADPNLLRAMIDTARDAIWCIEYVEPVDLATPEAEIIRQIFENTSRWAVCNRAMARLYGLPEGVDFNERAVSAYFPREPANEELVRTLIAGGFNVDDAPAIDRRHDGSPMHVENDVRGEVRGGRLVRMWGTVRDVSERRAREARLSNQVGSLRDVLGAVPDPILVLDPAGVVIALNPAAETAFGVSGDALLGNAVGHALPDIDATRLGEAFDGLSLLPGRAGPVRAMPAAARSGQRFQLHVSPMEVDGGRRLVVTARAVDTNADPADGGDQ